MSLPAGPFRSHSPAGTARLASRFAKSLASRLPQGIVIGLEGELGSGKTTFVQGIAKGLGIEPTSYVNSPTFTLVNEYVGKNLRLVHLDLFRIEGPQGLETLPLADYGVGGEVVVIEWSEKLMGKIPLDFRVVFEIRSPRERAIRIHGV